MAIIYPLSLCNSSRKEFSPLLFYGDCINPHFLLEPHVKQINKPESIPVIAAGPEYYREEPA